MIRQLKQNFKNLIKGYGGLFKFPFSKETGSLLGFRSGLFFMLIILAAIGIIRNFLEVYIGGAWANQWFALRADIFFTMFFYPIYLCFFSTTLLYFFSRLFKLNVKISEILSLCFLVQVTHLIIPFFDSLEDLFHIPHSYLVSMPTYIKLIFSPLAFTPVIIFLTRPTSLGIDITWLFVTFVLVKLYCRHFKFHKIKSLLVLGITFYITYMSIYPNYTFFLNERVIGSNFMFGLFFMFMSIPSIMFVCTLTKEEKETAAHHVGRV